MTVGSETAVDGRTRSVFTWDAVDPVLIRHLLRDGYAFWDQDEPRRRVGGMSDEVLRRRVGEVLNRPLALSHMDWAIDTLCQRWIPRLGIDALRELVFDISRTVDPSYDPSDLPRAKLLKFVEERNHTESLRRVIRGAFVREHKCSRPVGPRGAGGGTSEWAGPSDLLGADEPAKIEPAAHQYEGWAGLEALAAGRLPATRAGILVLPTGAGKTFTAVHWLLRHLAGSPSRRVLWIADQQELVDQSARAFEQESASMPAEFTARLRVIHSSASRPSTLADPELRIACITRPSLWSTESGNATNKRLLRTFLTEDSVVVVDEAHHAASKSYVSLLSYIREWYPSIMMVGLTATPWPSGRGAVAKLRAKFPVRIHEVRPAELVANGFLAKPIIHRLDSGEVVKLNAAERSAATRFDVPPSVFERLDNPHRNQLLVDAWIENKQEWGRTLVFACAIAHADELHRAFERAGVPSMVVHSKSIDDLRRARSWFDQHEDPRVLVSVGVLLEGVDLPKARTAFIARPTTSRIVMRQMVGRVLRGPRAGGDSEAHIVDLRDTWVDELDPVRADEVIDVATADESEATGASSPHGLRPLVDDADEPISPQLEVRIGRAFADLSRELSLIRIEQRNGRIDRYGQRHPPRITALLLDPGTGQFGGDLRVLAKLMVREHEAHGALGDVASLMGEYKVEAEEAKIREVLAGRNDLDDVVRGIDEVKEGDDLAALFAELGTTAPDETTQPAGNAASVGRTSGLYDDDIAYLEEALHGVFIDPSNPPTNAGVAWHRDAAYGTAEMVPPPDLVQRLDLLPQAYLADRKVAEKLVLATTLDRGKARLAAALQDNSDSSWPDAHYLSPLHPVLDWVSDRALASLSRNEIFAVRGDVTEAVVLLLGTVTNRRGQVVAASWVTAHFAVDDALAHQFIEVHDSAAAALRRVGWHQRRPNTGALGVERLQAIIEPAVRHAGHHLRITFGAAQEDVERRVNDWSHQLDAWEQEADALDQRPELRQRRVSVQQERELVEAMRPDRQLIRPLLVVVPETWQTS